MSKPLKPIFVFAAVLFQILHFLNNASAQSADISVVVEESGVRISGTLKDTKGAPEVTNFSIADQYAGQTLLATRASAVELADRSGNAIEYRTLAPGEILASRPFASFRYSASIAPANPNSMAHVSWLEGGRGVLMCADLLPRFAGPLTIAFALPDGWRVESNEERTGGNAFRVDDPQGAVFVVGRSLRVADSPRGAARTVIDGDFLFADQDVGRMADEILAAYSTVFRDPAPRRPLVTVLRLPKEVRFGRWEAETRGASTLIVSADMPFSTQSVQRLHEQLRHELFHLWMPNSLALDGNYDWFFEGFALYQSLRTGVALNRIRFEDFLDTLARAYDADSMISVRRTLIESSRDRWSGANTQVYARGMLVAFLADLALLSGSKGKRSVTDILTAVWRDHRTGKPRRDGNTAIASVLDSFAELRTVVADHVRGSAPIDWRNALAAVGIEATTENFSTRLAVTPKPSGRQKLLLDKLGYNNWRNFLNSSK